MKTNTPYQATSLSSVVRLACNSSRIAANSPRWLREAAAAAANGEVGTIAAFGREAAAHGAAGLDGFEAFVAFDPAADFVNDLAQGDAQGDFDQAGVLDIPSQGEGLGAFAFLGAHAGKPFRALEDDLGNIRVGLNVVIIGRLAPQPGYCRERRLGARRRSDVPARRSRQPTRRLPGRRARR